VGGIVVALVVNGLALIAASQVVPGMKLDWQESPLTLLAVAAIFAVVNTFLRPIVNLLTLPVRLVTLGLVGIVINIAMLLVVAYVSGQLDLPFTISGWPDGPFGVDVLVTAFLGSLVISIVSMIVSLVLRGTRMVVPGI
jgi:putative membrane protein